MAGLVPAIHVFLFR